jgi:hypothetical protein
MDETGYQALKPEGGANMASRNLPPIDMFKKLDQHKARR